MLLYIFVAEVNVGKAGILLIHDALQVVDCVGTVEGVSTADEIRAL